MITKINVYRNKLTEASKSDLANKSRGQSPERWGRRLNYQVSDFKGVDFAQLFVNDYFVFRTPIGKSSKSMYTCTLAFHGALTELRKVAKATRGDATKVNLQLVIKALRQAFDKANDVKVRCTCPDFRYRYEYWARKGDYLFGKGNNKTRKFPEIRNPRNNIGATCKHLDVLLSNKRWLTKSAKVVNDLIRVFPEKAAKYLYNEDDLEKWAEDIEDIYADEMDDEYEMSPETARLDLDLDFNDEV